jgi:hypothetical protein
MFHCQGLSFCFLFLPYSTAAAAAVGQKEIKRQQSTEIDKADCKIKLTAEGWEKRNVLFCSAKNISEITSLFSYNMALKQGI